MKNIKIKTCAVAFAFAVLLSPSAPPAIAGGLPAGDYAGDFMIRAGLAGVLPNSKFDAITVDGTPGVFGSGAAEVDDSAVPHLTLSYFLTRNVAVELFCCFAQHGVQAAGPLSALDELGETMIFPPALTLQYHFDTGTSVKPYLGVGAQYIHFFDTSSSIGGTLEIDDAWGVVAQAGADIEMGNGWYLNGDIKYTWLESDAQFRNALGTGTDLDVGFDLDPLIVSVALGYRFNLLKSPTPASFK
ncbi:MAG: OmpW family outer membrane protein [Pseudomonadota bacterium]